jgi:predicted metal-dependent enzyme (double-stranded beta helix superfamily)
MSALPAFVPGQGLVRFAGFVDALAALIDEERAEADLIARATPLLAGLVAADDWLPASHAEPDAARYRQYLLYRDPLARFSVVSFIWGPGQSTPIHDHRTWGLVGVLRGAELNESFARDAEGAIRSTGPVRLLSPGAVEAVSPAIGDIHRVANAYDDRVSVSIHVYGADIGAVERATYDGNGQAKRFVSGYHPQPALIAWP